MKLKDYFHKPIDRSIETVIKAEDQDNILTEVEEYIVTNEIAKKISDFFELYNDFSKVNGVWISGFFGSGKSHLLKILSYVLENKEYDDITLGNLFAEKIVGDEILKANILKATQIPSKSILFNIDQQAQIASKKEDDAVLSVLYKVFYDYLGYFGSQRHVAEFELWLDEEGKYKEFKKVYEEETNESWYEGRRKYFAPKTKRAVAKVLSQIMGGQEDDYTTILDDLQKTHSISVDDFVEKVNKHINSKGKDFRLNFFIDEVGQFIADNTKLMLNIQTIAETLAVKCKGRAWILVTSQEDLDSVIGDADKSQTDDFSKIQGRFKARIPLTSANVDEVIEKRLLTKTESANNDLKNFYNQEQANLETLISFSANGIQFKKYRDSVDFVNKYPFLPYQFDLFQQCIKELSKHNVFQGKHHSVGERSMLGVFQEVLKSIASKENRVLVSFDKMFEGLRSVIKGEVVNSITFAENNLFDDLALKVLKTLFMVKYYTNFKTTAQNIAVLMIDRVDVNFKEHNDKIKKALDELENQTYIRRNGELYEYLTDDEKDIEDEIKNVRIDDSDILSLYNDLIYGGILGSMTKIRYNENKQDYEFTHKINTSLMGREKELSIDIITPDFEHYSIPNFFQTQTMGIGNLMMVVLPDDNRLFNEARIFKKTEKYIPQQQNSSNSESVRRILSDKAQQNIERKRNLTILLNKMLGEASIYFNGEKQAIPNSNEGKTKVVNAFQDLVKFAFPNLNDIGSIAYSEDTIKSILRPNTGRTIEVELVNLSRAENEVLNFINRRKNQADRTSLSDVKDYFARPPYGWYQNAVFTLIARLFKSGNIEAKQDSNMLSDEDFLSNLMNNRTFANTLLEPQIEFDAVKVERLKTLYLELFNEPCTINEAREIANSFKHKAKSKLKELNQLLGEKSNYPFLNILEPFISKLEKVSEMDYNYVIDRVEAYDNELLDYKEDALDPILKFWNGEQKKIYDSVLEIIRSDQSNLEYIESEELEILKALPGNSKPYLGNVIRDAKVAMDSLSQKLNDKIDHERNETLNIIRQHIQNIEQRTDFNKLDDNQKRSVTAVLNDMISSTYSQRYIAHFRQYNERANNEYTNALNLIQELLTPKSTSGIATEPKVRYIKQSNVRVNFIKTELVTPEDVEAYVMEMKKALLKQLEEKRRILL